MSLRASTATCSPSSLCAAANATDACRLKIVATARSSSLNAAASEEYRFSDPYRRSRVSSRTLIALSRPSSCTAGPHLTQRGSVAVSGTMYAPSPSRASKHGPSLWMIWRSCDCATRGEVAAAVSICWRAWTSMMPASSQPTAMRAYSAMRCTVDSAFGSPCNSSAICEKNVVASTSPIARLLEVCSMGDIEALPRVQWGRNASRVASGWERVRPLREEPLMSVLADGSPTVTIFADHGPLVSRIGEELRARGAATHTISIESGWLESVARALVIGDSRAGLSAVRDLCERPTVPALVVVLLPE